MTTSNIPARPKQEISEAQKAAITIELERLLNSTWFRTSPRCSKLLRHTVKAAIEGQYDQLRERQIGINAFRRDAGYDSDADPVVRIAAGDVRKRLAQYYSDPETTCQIKIELPVGSYIPVIHFLNQEAGRAQPDLKITAALGDVKADIADTVMADGSSRPPALALQPSRSRRWIKPVFAAFLVLLVIALVAWTKSWPGMRTSGFDEFWAPVVSAQRQPLICVGEVFSTSGGLVPNGARSRLSEAWTVAPDNRVFPNGIPVIMIYDNLAATRVASVLGRKSNAFDVLGESETSFNDFLSRPVILIGSYNNDWTIHITDSMRFRFEIDMSQRLGWISDRDRPAEKIGVVSNARADPPTFNTFAIVARAVDPTLSRDQPIVVVAGQTSTSTKAAAEFVSDPSYLNDFARHAPRDWNRKNVEFLIGIPVVDNVPGRPRVVDYSIW